MAYIDGVHRRFMGSGAGIVPRGRELKMTSGGIFQHHP
jgi:hypothetical protein